MAATLHQRLAVAADSVAADSVATLLMEPWAEQESLTIAVAEQSLRVKPNRFGPDIVLSLVLINLPLA